MSSDEEKYKGQHLRRTFHYCASNFLNINIKQGDF